jgi:hypothetical protein
VLWSELDAAVANRRRHSPDDKSAAARLEKVKLFLRKTQASRGGQMAAMSPQRNKFRVMDLPNPSASAAPTSPLPLCGSPSQISPPLPIDLIGSIPVPPLPPPPPEDDDGVEKCSGTGTASTSGALGVIINRNAALSSHSAASYSMTTSAFLAARSKAVLQEMRRQCSSGQSVNVGGGLTLTTRSEKTTEIVRKGLVVGTAAEANRLQQVRVWAHTGLGQRLIDNPNSWVGAVFLLAFQL